MSCIEVNKLKLRYIFLETFPNENKLIQQIPGSYEIVVILTAIYYWF